MAKRKQVLGKGLGALIPTPGKAATQANGNASTKPERIPMTAIVPNPYQPRKHFEAEALAALAESIREHGLVQPIVVRRVDDGYELVAGERRWRACRLLHWQEIEAIVKDYSTEQTSEIALVENLQRQDLDPIEEACAYERLRETFHVTQEEMAQRLGRSRSHIANMVRLLKLAPGIQNALSAGDVAVGVVRPLLAITDLDQQWEAYEHIMAEGFNARQVEAYVKSLSTSPKAEKPETPSTPAYVDAVQLDAIRDQLKLSLGAPVDLKFKKGKDVKGTIQIAFASEEELERLLHRLGQEAEANAAMPSKTDALAEFRV